MGARALVRLAAGLVLVSSVAACGPKNQAPAFGQQEADRFLFERGNEHLKKKNWLSAREYYRRLVDSYPQSQFRTDAKLAIGDTYIGENQADSRILAANEFREFLQFYPLNPRADYAQFRLCVALSKQMLKAQLDQTHTVETLREIERFNENYPKSQYKPDVDKLFREARDRLSEHEFRVGMTYFNARYMRGALPRFLQVLKDDPGYTKRDQVYFFIGDAFRRSNSAAEAAPFYERVIVEFPKSKYAGRAKKRLEEMKKRG